MPKENLTFCVHCMGCAKCGVFPGDVSMAQIKAVIDGHTIACDVDFKSNH